MSGAYLDHAATTPMAPEAVERWREVAAEGLGNSSGGHRRARSARSIVEECRALLAEQCGVPTAQVVWTSGGTEADHLGIDGLAAAAAISGDEMACSAVEHPAVRQVVERAGGRVLAVDRRGHLDLDALARACAAGVRLVAVMGVNNETGVVQRDAEIGRVLADAPTPVLWHCDSVQSFAWRDLRSYASTATGRALSAHKFGGPGGVGALVLAPGASVSPLFVGGGQERGWRSGSHAVASIAAMAVAAGRADAERTERAAAIGRLRDRFVAEVRGSIDDVDLTAAPGEDRLPADVAEGFAHLLVGGVDSDSLLVLLDQADVAVSAGSSCSSGATQVSPVLAAMGVEPERAAGAVRVTLGWTTTEDDVDRGAQVLVDSVRRLRSRAGA